MSDDNKIDNDDKNDVISGFDNPTRMAIPGDTVKLALDRLVESEALDDDGRDLVWWFYCYSKDQKWRLRDCAEAIKSSTTTVHRLFNGTYGASYDGIIAAVAAFKKIADERAKRKQIGFIETSAWNKISRVCNAALYDNMPAFIYGASQLGKTECLREFARRNNHGTTRYVRMPSSPTFPFFLKIVAEACYLSPRQKHDALRRRIMDALDDRNLIIVDEVHQAMCTASELNARKVVEFLREIYDRTGCGIVLCGTKVFRDEFERGRQALIFDQFRRRGMLELVLPDSPTKADITKIAGAFELPAPDGETLDLIKSMLQTSGLGKYIKFLQYANGVSVNRKESLTWTHFRDAYAGVRALSAPSK